MSFALSLHKGAVFEGVQLFTLEYTCEDCKTVTLIYLGPSINLPLGMELARALIDTEEKHVCPKPAPPMEEPERMPY